MRIVIAGPPGSGKTTLALKLKDDLLLPYVCADKLFWVDGNERGIEEFRSLVQATLESADWIYEGHLSKTFDLLTPHRPQLIVINVQFPFSFLAVIAEDLWKMMNKNDRPKALKRIIHHCRYWKEIQSKRRHLLAAYEKQYPELVFHWDKQSETITELLARLNTEKPRNLKLKESSHSKW